MTAVFDAAFKTVVFHEGGFSNDPNDPGGATNFGISLRYLRTLGEVDGDVDHDGDVDIDDIRMLTVGQTWDIFKTQWWDRYGYQRLNSPTVATKVFDLAVNMGPRRAHLVAQRACRALERPVPEDSLFGPVTVLALNVFPDNMVLPALRAEAAGVYRGLVLRRPTLEKYLRGWLNRAYA